MHLLMIHGWGVRDTGTYGELPAWLARQSTPEGGSFRVTQVHLGQYITLDDSLHPNDIARAFEQALQDQLIRPRKLRRRERFACVTHSTGGPIIRTWFDLFHRARPGNCPLSHLIMLAPPNHGSALAQLGKSRLARLKALLQHEECGRHILDWLELGSPGAWELNQRWLDTDPAPHGLFPFVLTGQRIDRQLYDALNSYTDEAGSDGVIRAAAANLNFSFVQLVQRGSRLVLREQKRSPAVAFGVLPGQAHSGSAVGIQRSVTLENADQHPTAQWILRCLRVRTTTSYRRLTNQLASLTDQTQAAERKERVRFLLRPRTFNTSRYSMVVFRFLDNRGNALRDYDLLFTSGPGYSDNELPPGFLIDRQRNHLHHDRLTFYLDHDALVDGLSHPRLEGRFGLRVVARPESGLVSYRSVEFRSHLRTWRRFLRPNETTLVEIQLERRVDKTVFRLADDLSPARIDHRPSGVPI